MIVVRPAPFFTLVVLLITGCTNQESPKSSNQSTSQQVSNVSEVIDVMKRADKSPNFSCKDNAGQKVDFDSYKGKVTLVNFWATWCGPCKRELPDLITLSRELESRGFKIIGVSTDRGSNVIEDVRSFVKDHGIPYQVVVSDESLEEAFGNVRALPTSFLIDGDGKIVQSFVGLRTKEFFTRSITPLLQ